MSRPRTYPDPDARTHADAESVTYCDTFTYASIVTNADASTFTLSGAQSRTVAIACPDCDPDTGTLCLSHAAA